MVERLKKFENTPSVPVLRSFVFNFLKCYLSTKSFDKLLICMLVMLVIFAKLEGKGKGKKENVRQIMEAAPSSSLRHLSQQVHLSVGSCDTVTKKDLHLFPYRLTFVQELHENDFPQSTEFCQWVLGTFDDNLPQTTFFTDEVWFHLNAYHPRKVVVWVAVSCRRIIGPYFFDGNINDVRYREEILTPFLNELHNDELIFGYFQQDHATCHTTRVTV
ncbi:DDE 3 domain containing protein [Asbolus verrucosus]|uniref:DDE 3 domain containing protein n=1 Tax=Asbolus verrucosus TaxID=1661398 RepID=A0A482WCA2_ASBVE|nr:DDE 3 domain containing protein [Asbolus verrucosus]